MAQKSKGQEFLKFGQIIRIHGHKCIQEQQGTHEKRGMIAVKGFTDLDARYVTFDKFKNCEFYRQTLFQVLPKGVFTNSNNPDNKKKTQEVFKDLIANKMGCEIKFGEDMIFKHVDSEAYLSGSVRCSDGGLGAFKVELSDELSENLVFRLYPLRSFEKEGDKIKLESPLRIKNISNRCYVSTEKNQAKYNIVTTYSQSFTWLIHLHQGHETLSDTQKIRTHDILFLTHTKNQGYLCLEGPHKQKRPCIKLPLQQTGFPCYTCLWEIQKWSIPQISPYPDLNLGTEGTYSLRDVLTGQYLQVYKLQQIQLKMANRLQFTIDTKQVDSKQISIKSAKGGLNNPNQYMVNRGLIKICGPKAKSEGQLDAGDQTKLSFNQFNYRQASPYQINEGKYSEIESEHGFRILRIDEQSKRQVFFVLSTYEILKEFVNKLQKKTYDLQAILKFKFLDMIDSTLKKLIGFIKNCQLSEIEDDILPQPKKQFIAKDLQICPILFKILEQMGVKILEQIFKKNKNQNQIFKKVFNRAYYLILQIIKLNPMTKLYVCETWLPIILDHAVQNQEETVHETLNQILKSNELVVGKFLKADNNHLVHRIINIFTLKPPHEKFLNIFRASCMSNEAPIVSNQNLVLSIFFRKLEPVAKFQFIKKVRRRKSENIQGFQEDKKIYLKCCISKDNQDTRDLKQFFQDSSRLDLSQTSNYFTAYLNLLADICYGRNTDAKKYVMEILVPIRDRPVPNTAPQLTALDTLIGILQDSDLKPVKGSLNLLVAVLRLINYAFVESADQNPVLRINRYRNLNNMIRNKQEVDPKFRNVMGFIKQSLQNFESFYDKEKKDKDKDKQKQKQKQPGKQKEIDQEKAKRDKKQREHTSYQEKQFYLTTLVLLKSTLIIGYWTVEEQQADLIPLLLKLLSNEKKDILHQKIDEIDTIDKQEEEFRKFKDEARRYTPAVSSIMDCKALACQLIEIIFDFRHDDLVTKCASAYNQLFANTQMIKAENSMVDMDRSLIKSSSTYKKNKNQFYNIQIWKNYLRNIFGQGQQSNDKTTTKLIPLMAELSIHRNPLLFFRSLTILKRHFQFRFDIFKLFLNLSIYDNSNGSQLAQKIYQRRNVLNKLQEENLLYISKSGVYDQIMNFLVWLSEAIKVDTDQSLQPNYTKFSSIFEHYNERSSINKFHQRLIKNKDLHPVMLKFIGLSRQQISTFTPDARLALKYIYRFLTLLVKSFKEAKMQVLPLLQKIKSHAKEECELVKQQNLLSSRDQVQLLERRDDCEAIELLFELFSHNKRILYNQTYMEETSAQFCSMVNQVSIYNYYKSHLLNFFRSFIYYNDKHIKVNQSRILAKLQDSIKKNILYREVKTQPESLKQSLFQQLIQDWQNENQQLLEITKPQSNITLMSGEQYPVSMSPRLTYFVTLFNLFANLVEGGHTVNIGKCQQVHTYQTLMNILKSGSICYPLKTHLRNYINQLYYAIGVEEDLCEPIIKMQIPLIIEDLNKIIVIICKNIQGDYYIAHPIRYKYYITYFYLYIQQIIFTLNYLFSDDNFNKSITQEMARNYSRGYYYLHYYVIRIYQRLRWIVNNYYQHRYLRNFINKVTNKIKKSYLQKFRQVAFRIWDRNEETNHKIEDFDQTKPKAKVEMNQVRVDALNRRSKNLLHKLIKGEIGNYFSVNRPEKDNNFPLTFVLPYQDETQANDGGEKKHREEELNKLAEKLKILLFTDDGSQSRKDYHFRKLIKLKEQLIGKAQFIQFMVSFEDVECNEIYRIDDHSINNYNFKGVFVSFKEYVDVFVKVNSEKPESISNDLKIFFFKVLLQYIKKFKQKNKLKPVELWTQQDWVGKQKQIEANQNFLKKANVAELLIETIKKCDDIILFSSIMHFGMAFVLRGNRQCQNSILQKLYEDKKNEVFLKLQKQISRLGKKITSRISDQTFRKVPSKEEFMVESLDLYDYYDPKLKVMKKMVTMETYLKDQTEEEQIDRQVFTRTFRFLQFLCQNNNIKAKQFVREQVNKNGQKNNYSFNLINTTTFQIRRLFKVMNKEASQLIMPLVEFLNEVVTIPVVENQKSLCETTFFQDLCYMASFFKGEANLRERGLHEEATNQKLFQIYHKCITITLNVLQGNDPNLVKELASKLDAKFLLDIIQKNLKSLKIENVKDFQKFLYDPIIQTELVPRQIEIAMNVVVVLEKIGGAESQKFQEKKKAYLKDIEKSSGYELSALVNILTKQLRKIQIISKQGKQFIYFPNHPILTKLSHTTRDRIMNQVLRSTQMQKIRSLFGYKTQVYEEIKHNFITEKTKFFGLSIEPSKIQQLKEFSLNIAHIINIIWFITTDVFIQYSQVFYETPLLLIPFIKILDLIQLAFTLALLISYTKCNYKLAQFRASENKDGAEQQTGQELLDLDNVAEGNSADIKQPKKDKGLSIVRFFTWLMLYIQSTRLMIIIKYDEKFVIVFFYAITSLAGTFYFQGLYLFYLIFYFKEHPTLSNVFNAIVYNIDQLLSVSLLGLAFVYIFSLIFFSNYSKDIMADNDNPCDTISGCILDLYVSGSINGSVEQFKFLRFATDLSWFIFFGLLFGNIVSGIMIDTFAQLRSKRDRMDDDKKNMCYICGKDRGMLQKNNESFDQHIEKKHFLWNYIFYMYCLRLKDKNYYSGLEYEIQKCIESGSGEEDYIKWVPFQTDEGEEKHGEKIVQLKDTMLKLNVDSEDRIGGMKRMMMQALSQGQQSAQ